MVVYQISGPWRGMSGVSAILRAASPQTMRTIAVDVTATEASEECRRIFCVLVHGIT